MREGNRASSSPGLFMIGIAAIFLAGFFLLVIFGAQSYRNTVAGQEENMNRRALLSTLSTAARAGDRSGAVTVRREGAYAPVLVIEDGESGYATLIYQYGGELLEDYARADAEPSPERSQLIGETERFEISSWDSVIELRTDAGRVLFHPRSGGGAA